MAGGGAMSDHDDVLGQAAAWKKEGKEVATATVVTTWGSAPRPVGSLLAVDGNGNFVGSVSGGCIEGAVVREALEVMQEGRPRLLEFGVSNAEAWEVGLACGGTIEIYVEPWGRSPKQRNLLHQLLADLAAKRPVALATNLKSGEKNLLYLIENNDISPWTDATRAALRADKSGTVEGPDGQVFVNVFNPPLRRIIVGAVHITQSLAPMAKLTGYEVIVVDPRRAFATEERFPGLILLDDWPDEAMARLEPDGRTAVVALTHDPKLDEPALAAALKSDAFYVGALGSKKTHAARLERLRGEGLSEVELARIHGPIGLAIDAETPAEIAVAVMAQVTQALRRAGNPEP